MRIVAAQEFATTGEVLVFGAAPAENDEVLRRIVFIREEQVYPDFRVAHALQVASWFYPNWSNELAAHLLADFELPPSRPIKKLSRGMRSALGIIIGLAARAELTLFDEPYAGLDAVARQLFYDRLLADFAEHPRTVVLSTHLIDEVADLLERVVMLDHGRVVVDAPIDEIRGSGFHRPRHGDRRGAVRGRPPGLAPAALRFAGLGRRAGAARRRRAGPGPCTASEPGAPVVAGVAGARLRRSPLKRR